MVNRLVKVLFVSSVHDPGQDGKVQNRIDLIKREPILHPPPEVLKDRPGEILVEPNELPVCSPAVLLRQVQRQLVVAERHQRYNIVCKQFVDDAIVKRQPPLHSAPPRRPEGKSATTR